MSQSIVITGATGVLGRRAVAALAAAGHDVTGVVSSPARAGIVEAAGGRAVAADVFDAAALERAFAGADAVVNLLTRIPPVERMLLPGAWRENDRLRAEASAVVARAARAAGARRLVQESIAFLYAEGGGAWLDEDARLEPTGPPATAAVAERNARAAFGGEAVVLRFAGLVAPESDQTRGQLAQARRGLSTVPVRAGGYVPTVWIDDAAAAVAAALRVPGGTYNVADDEPPTRAGLDAALAAAVGRERLRAPLARVGRAVPRMRVLARSLRPANARLRATGLWAPAVRSGVDGWALAARAAVPA